MVASNPKFHHYISTVVQSDVKAKEFMKHIAKILSSKKDLDITKCRFNVKIFSISRGSKTTKIINLANIRTKKRITQVNNSDNLCCTRASSSSTSTASSRLSTYLGYFVRLPPCPVHNR